MAELITEVCPRIKYTTHFVGNFEISDGIGGSELHKLSRLMNRMEILGAAPILNDGQVAGNCAVSPSVLVQHAACKAAKVAAQRESSPTQGPQGLALVSMSGKPPGHILDPCKDFVLVTSFDRNTWAVDYRSREPSVRPSSDSPLLTAALALGGDYGWEDEPFVVLHGHALAEGEGKTRPYINDYGGLDTASETRAWLMRLAQISAPPCIWRCDDFVAAAIPTWRPPDCACGTYFPASIHQRSLHNY